MERRNAPPAERGDTAARDRGGFPWIWVAIVALLIPLAIAGYVARGDETEVAEEHVGPADTTPLGLDDLPEGVESATIVVASGALEADELILQEDQPTILFVVNRDGRAYRFGIDGPVSVTPLPAATTTEVEFTTPNAATYEGRLFAADTDEMLDTIEVVVLPPGGVQP